MTSRKWLIVLIILVALFGMWGTLAAHGMPADLTASEAQAFSAGVTAPESVITPTAESPAISLIDNHDPTCYRPVAGTGICYINWNYLSVAAEPGQYVISMTVNIGGQIRAYHAGFFQDTMYIPGSFYGPGFQVTCGMPGSGGVANLGKTYNYTVRARETGGLGSANYGSVTCPADRIQVFLPVTRKR